MKKIIKYTSIFIGILLLNACSEDFLDSMPTTQLTEANFYRTIRDADMALTGCYDGMQRLNSQISSFPLTSVYLSDNVFAAMGAADGYGQQMIQEFDRNRAPGDVNYFGNIWGIYYQAIFRVNMLLSKMDQIDWQGDDDLRTDVEAQARFMRAYLYFDLVRLFERVPLLTEPSSENLPQAEPDETYALITDDLLFVAENGSEEVRPGRGNKWAAKAYIARVFQFYTGYYGKPDLAGRVTQAQALQGLEDIIATDRYALVPEFKNLWPVASATISGDNLISTFAGKDHPETVFSIKHNITSNYNGNTDGNHWMVMIGLRGQTFPPYGRGWGGATVRSGFYNSFEEGDLRRDASIIALEEEGLEFDLSDQREYTGYVTKKYIPMSNPDGSDVATSHGGVNFQIGQYQDFVSMRYADVLLMAAELGSDNAQAYFDEVRNRAGLESKPVNKANIMNERRFEFAFEGIRYWDLLRQGLDVAAAAVETNTTVLNGGNPVTKVIRGENLINTRGFQQIPGTQITLSGGVLQQNQGW